MTLAVDLPSPLSPDKPHPVPAALVRIAGTQSMVLADVQAIRAHLATCDDRLEQLGRLATEIVGGFCADAHGAAPEGRRP